MTATAFGQNATSEEAQIWVLEKSYWEYVKANDLEKYRALWHENFVGWPLADSTPVRKDDVTDWMTENASKEVKLQSYSIEQLAICVTGDVAIDHYRIKMNWANREGPDATTEALRITHTWIRTQGTWQILGGMAAPVNSEGK
jgi:ketosteroid isomerase-like protein